MPLFYADYPTSKTALELLAIAVLLRVVSLAAHVHIIVRKNDWYYIFCIDNADVC